ncbi:uroporphyrin-III C-methyltransferase [Aneurinibacillus soli]|uniref:Uroporphyrinogen-III C-methyltransferase n=1 Tax=Aneurinibacillus soli TaxID=1500254 RepID=A0A0U5B4S0_9BACL|nr:uroporphyrinogen-III C-methyltransferase [Aneurinibacillus soli]PYE61866.1 uroporphyrin-III C-methyltransferase [Aneurinibacillus soli]BAU29682.1 Uroporphyrinogen-III C-methyltransferase [Aneurinibacillus soli]
MRTGKVYLVGAGPGDPKLITIRGAELIKQADVIVYDRLVHPHLLTYARNEAKLVYCGKLSGNHSMPQEQINQELVRYAQAGKQVVRLKGGDPFVFGRGGEEAEACVEVGIPFEIVPGVTAGIAAPAYAGIPVTHREYGSSFAIVTGHAKAGQPTTIEWEKLATAVDTLVFYMGVGNLPEIVSALLFHGRADHTPVALVRWGTYIDQQDTLVGTLATIIDDVKRAGFTSPAIIIVGDVVKLREKLAWFESKQHVFQSSGQGLIRHLPQVEATVGSANIQ